MERKSLIGIIKKVVDFHLEKFEETSKQTQTVLFMKRICFQVNLNFLKDRIETFAF